MHLLYRLVALAVPVDLAAADGLGGLEGVLTEGGLDGGELSHVNTLGDLEEEPLDGFGASAPGEGALVGEVLAVEGLGELLEVDEAVSQSLGGGSGTRSIDVLEEGVEETAGGLLVQEDGGDDEIGVTSGSGLLVGDLDFTSIALAVDGVVSGETDGDGLHVVAGTIARVAAAKSDETESASNSGSNLNSAALLLNGAVSSGLVVTADLVGSSIRFAGADTLSLLENNIDGTLVLTACAQRITRRTAHRSAEPRAADQGHGHQH